MKKDFYARLLGFILQKTPLIIYNNFMSAIKQDMRLTAFDEEIYDYYEKVICYFRKSERIYIENSDKIKSKAVRKLLNGLLSVLKSRIIICDETLLEYDHLNLVGEGINPVYVEKRTIVENAKKEIKERLQKIIEKYSEKMRAKFDNETSISEYVEFYDKFIMGDVIKLNDNIVKKYTSLINDIEQRKIVAGFYSLLKEEAQVLGAVIKVQANELEKVNQSEDEENVIQSLLFQLREAYQFVTSDVDKIRNQFGAVENVGRFSYHCNMYEFEIDKRSVEKFIAENKDAIIDETKEIFEYIKELTEKISDSFENIIKAEKFVSKDNKKIYDIVNGVDETIKIKIETLNESLENIMYFADSRQITREKAEKTAINYLKQSLLFEIATFEEIMMYSVSKLRENNSVKGYVNTIDDEMNNINRYLEEAGIEIISPQSKDIFSAKEHDILMAEKAEGYKKGEIIKVMTKGYKKGNQVYIRASVIAAK